MCAKATETNKTKPAQMLKKFQKTGTQLYNLHSVQVLSEFTASSHKSYTQIVVCSFAKQSVRMNHLTVRETLKNPQRSPLVSWAVSGMGRGERRGPLP